MMNAFLRITFLYYLKKINCKINVCYIVYTALINSHNHNSLQIPHTEIVFKITKTEICRQKGLRINFRTRKNKSMANVS